MAAPIGTNEINSLSRRYILPMLVDNVYNSSPLFFRLNRRNKKQVQGGLHIEVPLVYQQFAAGGSYSGFDLLDVSPSDTVKNAAFDWKQYYVPISIDGLTRIRMNSPEAVLNALTFMFEQAQVQMVENLSQGIWSTSTGTGSVDGIQAAIDNGAVAATYGGLPRSTNPFWNAQVAAATAPLSLSQIQNIYGLCTDGGRHPTIILNDQAVYNIYWNLLSQSQAFPVQPQGMDEQLAQAGFTNLLFNGVPMVVDSHAPAGDMFFLNEDYMTLVVASQADFRMNDFREPVNQDAMVSLLLWAGNMVFYNVQRQGKLTGITG